MPNRRRNNPWARYLSGPVSARQWFATPAARLLWRVENGIAERQTPCYRITNADDGGAHVFVYDVIGGWDLDAQQFVRDVTSLDTPSLTMHINSPGGYVFDAISMYSAVVNSPAASRSIVEGVAASAASFLALASDTTDIEKPARMMIHDASGVGIGTASDMRDYADMLDAVSDDIAGIYADQAGGTPADWRATMTSGDTWYSSSEAVTAGLAHTVLNDRSAATDQRTANIRARARAHLKGQR